MISLSYYGEDDSHSYFTYSKGYRPGGYSFRTSDLLIPFLAESTDSYELGYKKVWDKSFRFNGAIFYNDITDHRTTTLSDTLSSITFNADKAYSYGVELDMGYKSENFELFSTLGWTTAKFDTISNPLYTQFEGNKLLEVPNLTASLAFKYTINENFYIQGITKYMGERYYNVANSAKADSYSLTNVALGYKKSGWEAQIYANNLFDKEYVDFMISTPSSGDYYHFGSPRVVGVKVSKRF